MRTSPKDIAVMQTPEAAMPTTTEAQRWITVRGKRIPVTAPTGRRTTAQPAQPQQAATPHPSPLPRYQYTPEQTAESAARKFARVTAFAVRMPRLRQSVDDALNLDDTPREKVVAAVIALMDRCKFRIGTERYAEAHGTYGVTTLRPEHVQVKGDEVTFDFTGKKGIRWERAVTDPRLAKLVASLKQQAGETDPLFWYRRPDGGKARLTSAQVNEALHEWGISGKDIRTFHATRMAWERLREANAAGPPKDEKEAKRRAAAVVRQVAAELGHTPAVCKSSYIMPELLEGYVSSAGRNLEAPFEKRAGKPEGKPIDGRFTEDPKEEEFRQWVIEQARRRIGVRQKGKEPPDGPGRETGREGR